MELIKQEGALMYIVSENQFMSKKRQLREVEEIKVTKTEKTITKHLYDLPGLGPVSQSERTGKYFTDRVSVHYTNNCMTLLTKPEKIKDRIRKVREEELKELQAIDEHIRQLKIKRMEVKKIAWLKGHVVTVKELTNAASGK